jgi:hypothetical protein
MIRFLTFILRAIMGQAKLRKEEIIQLKSVDGNHRKARSESIQIIAVMHYRDNTDDVVGFKTTITDIKDCKDKLLKTICTKRWGFNPPLNEIAEYLLMTDGYKIAKLFNAYGIAVHFYESDIDISSAYSCRNIIGIADENMFRQLGDEYVSTANSLTKCINLNFN